MISPSLNQLSWQFSSAGEVLAAADVAGSDHGGVQELELFILAPFRIRFDIQ